MQFDFPDENGRPYKSSGGKMVWNEKLKREIPEGWRVKRVDECAVVQKGSVITSSEARQGNIKVVAAALDFAYYHDTANRRLNCITVSSSGANAGYINFWREPIYASDCTTVQAVDDLDTLICLYGLKLHQPRLFGLSQGSAQPHVYPNQIAELPIVVPPIEIKEKIRSLLININNEQANNSSSLSALTKLRDELLPLLMNGQVRVEG